MKKQLLICSFNLEIGGIERSLIGLMHAIDYDRCDVDLFLYAHKGELMKQVPSRVNILPEIKQYSVFGKSARTALFEGHLYNAAARFIAKCLAFSRRKILGVHGPYMTRVLYWSLPFLPKLTKEYDLAISFMTPHYFILYKVAAQKKIGWVHTDYTNLETGVDVAFESSMWQKLDIIAAVSYEVKRNFVKVFSSINREVVVIENILSQEFVRRQAAAYIITEMPKENGVIRLCTVGRFSYAKGMDEAILACKKLMNQGYNIKWYVVGFGPDEPLMRRMIADNGLVGRFIILGRKVNPYPYMKACDIYVQPSRYEGKAVTVREAQMLGKPVVITNFPTAKSQLEDGVDGLITPLGVEGIVEGIAQMIDNPALCRRLGRIAATRNYGNACEVEKIYTLI